MAKWRKNLGIHSQDAFETERQNYNDAIRYEAQYDCTRYEIIRCNER